MKKSLFFRLSVMADYCCPHELLRSNEVHSSLKLAEILGCSHDTVDRWRKAKDNWEIIRCPDCPPPGSKRKPLPSRASRG